MPKRRNKVGFRRAVLINSVVSAESDDAVSGWLTDESGQEFVLSLHSTLPQDGDLVILEATDETCGCSCKGQLWRLIDT